MIRYSCPLAEAIGHRHSLAPKQVWPGDLRSLGSSWHPQGRDLAEALNAAAGLLEDELQRLGLPQDRPAGSDEDGREMARRAMSRQPVTATLLAEVERGWARRDALSR